MYFYFLNLDTASFQSSGLNRLTESATTTVKIAKGINTSIIYSYEGEGGNSGNGLTGGVASLYSYKACSSGTVVQALIATTCC